MRIRRLIDEQLTSEIDFRLVDHHYSTPAFLALVGAIYALEPESQQQVGAYRELMRLCIEVGSNRSIIESITGQSLSVLEWSGLILLLLRPGRTDRHHPGRDAARRRCRRRAGRHPDHAHDPAAQARPAPLARAGVDLGTDHPPVPEDGPRSLRAAAWSSIPGGTDRPDGSGWSTTRTRIRTARPRRVTVEFLDAEGRSYPAPRHRSGIRASRRAGRDRNADLDRIPALSAASAGDTGGGKFSLRR